MSTRIKYVILIMFLTLLPLTCASTYILGSHQVSFNVSEPYNSSAKLDAPIYLSASDDWTYTLNMTVGWGDGIKIMVNELSVADYGRTWPSNFAATRPDWMKANGIGGYKSSTMDFRGYPAYQESYPAQRTYQAEDGIFVERHERHALNYMIDERTVVHVLASGNNTSFQEILDTIEVTEASTTPTKYAPYISQ